MHGDLVVFGPFEAHLGDRVLRREGVDVHLTPMSWQLLGLLIRERGRTVTKHDVMTALWPDEPATEYAMSRAVRRLREALDDDARNPRYLRTVHRNGFQWIATTHVAVPAGDDDGHGTGGDGPGEGGAAPHSPALFVGRRDELAALTAEAAVALGGRRRLVSVEGDLGVGKTTLVQRFVDDSADAWWTATAQCVESRSGAEPYGPVLAAIDRLAARRPDVVVEALRRCAPTWLAQLPWLDDRIDPVAMHESMLQSSRGRMLRELVRVLDDLSTVAPLMLVLDDVHWADPATVDAIDTVATMSEPARLLVVTCHRPSDALAADHPITAVVARHDTGRRACRLHLRPFPGVDVAELVRLRLPEADGEGDGIADQLIGWTGGNALFTVTALDHVQRQVAAGGGLERFDGVTVLDQLPPSLRDLLDGQVARLSGDDTALLEVAALIGPEVLPGVVAEVLQLDGADVEQAAARLARTTPILGESPADGDRHTVVEFSHAAFRQTFLDRVGRIRGERLHRRIAEALEPGVRGGTASPRQVAHHFEAGGAPQRAVPYWLRAGRLSHRRFAHHDALDLYERAVATLNAHAGSHPPHVELQARLGLAICQLFLRSSENADTRDNIEALQRLVEPLRSEPDGFAAWQSVLLINNLAGRVDRVQDMAPPLMEMARRRGRSEELMDAHHSMGEAALHAGALDESLHHFGRADELLTAGSGSELWLRDSGGRIKSALAGVQLLRKEISEVPDHVAASLALCTDGPNTPIVRVGNHAICAAILALLGEHSRAGDLARRTLDLADDENEDFRAVANTVRWASGDVAPADEVRAAVDTMLTRPTVPFPLGLVVFFGADLLPPDELLTLLDRTRAQCARVDTNWADPEFLRVRARLVLETSDDVEQAAALLAEAIALADGQGGTFFHDRATADLAALTR